MGRTHPINSEGGRTGRGELDGSMHGFNGVTVRLAGVLVMIMSFGIFTGEALAGDSYTPAPPVAVPVQPEHERHGVLIAAQHPRTRLVDGSGPNPEPNYFARPGYPVATPRRKPPTIVDNPGWPTPAPASTPRFISSPSFFPPRPANAEIRYRTGVLTDWEVGNKSGYAAITDAAGNTFGYFTGWPMFIDGKQTHCAIPPRRGFRFDSFGCEGGWPADIVFGETRVRIYYWHDVTPWGQHVAVTDRIIKAP